MAWTCSGGRLETGGVGVTVVWGFGVVIAGGLDGEIEFCNWCNQCVFGLLYCVTLSKAS